MNSQIHKMFQFKQFKSTDRIKIMSGSQRGDPGRRGDNETSVNHVKSRGKGRKAAFVKVHAEIKEILICVFDEQVIHCQYVRPRKIFFESKKKLFRKKIPFSLEENQPKEILSKMLLGK